MQMRAARRRHHSGPWHDGLTTAFMPWNARLLLGFAEIDRQHHWLVNRINALHRELSRPAPRRRIVGHVLHDLVDYSHNHFIVEEVLFQQHGYPETPAHKAEHDGFTRHALEWLTRFEQGETVSLEAMGFLKEWLTHHICEVDRAYAPFFRARGLG